MEINLAGCARELRRYSHGVVMGVRWKDDVVKGRQRFEVGENVTPKTSRARATVTGAPTTGVTTTRNDGRLECLNDETDGRLYVGDGRT